MQEILTEVAAMYDKSEQMNWYLDITASSDGRNTTVELVRNVAESFYTIHSRRWNKDS